MSFTDDYLNETIDIINGLDRNSIEKMVSHLVQLRQRGGRLFILGVGGGAAHASHAVNDFRKIAGLQAYTPLDNVSELTARINDDGWDKVFVDWLKACRLSNLDMVFVFSVGGGNVERNVSANLVRALEYARQIGAGIVGVVGRDGGYTAQVADACVVVPTVMPSRTTPHTEGFQAIIFHLLVSHPDLQMRQTKWESLC